jgi:hypothetical protein
MGGLIDGELERQLRDHPPEVGTRIDWPCGCVAWKSGDMLYVLACFELCPYALWMQGVVRDAGKAISYGEAL